MFVPFCKFEALTYQLISTYQKKTNHTYIYIHTHTEIYPDASFNTLYSNAADNTKNKKLHFKFGDLVKLYKKK